MTFNNDEYEQQREALAQALYADTKFRTERTLLLQSTDQRTIRMVIQLLSIRVGDMNPSDLEDIWPEDLIELARKAAEPPAGPSAVVNGDFEW